MVRTKKNPSNITIILHLLCIRFRDFYSNDFIEILNLTELEY
jgi:hypothetical protein